MLGVDSNKKLPVLVVLLRVGCGEENIEGQSKLSNAAQTKRFCQKKYAFMSYTKTNPNKNLQNSVVDPDPAQSFLSKVQTQSGV